MGNITHLKKHTQYFFLKSLGSEPPSWKRPWFPRGAGEGKRARLPGARESARRGHVPGSRLSSLDTLAG